MFNQVWFENVFNCDSAITMDHQFVPVDSTKDYERQYLHEILVSISTAAEYSRNTIETNAGVQSVRSGSPFWRKQLTPRSERSVHPCQSLRRNIKLCSVLFSATRF